uniref:TraB domain-containing protein n=2 Tax=Loa loa TaxID=7209 RepID=A0A1I7V9H1_LOALO
MSANGTEADNITPMQNEGEHGLVPELNLDHVMLSDEETTFTVKEMSSSELTDPDMSGTKAVSSHDDLAGSIIAAQQSVVSLTDSASNVNNCVSDFGDNVCLGNKMKITETGGAKKDQHVHVEQRRCFGGFMFDRNRHPNPELPKETVTVLNYPFPPTAIPVGDDENEFRKSLADAKVYLIGTAHFSPDSQQDVLKTIANTQPDMVMVELCPSRISILSMDEDTLLEEAKNLNFDKIINTIKQSGAIQGILHVLLLSMSAHMTKTLGMAPGGEFRAAHKGAMNIRMCKLILGDRPIHVTVQRALSSLSFFQKLRLFYHIVLSHKTTITQEEVERCKKSDMLEELLKQMAGEFPLLSKIFVEERDLYMTNALHTLLKKSTFDKRVAWSKTDAAWQPISVVAVVGMGHVPGIISNWNKRIDVGDLLIIPQPTHTEKFIRLTLKAMIIGVMGYVFYQVGSKVVSRVQMLMK